jgi:hypothetical protein
MRQAPARLLGPDALSSYPLLMPWNVKKDSRCPASKPWGVVGGSTGNRLAGCHPSEDAAKKQQAALYVHETGWAADLVQPGPRISLT